MHKKRALYENEDANRKRCESIGICSIVTVKVDPELRLNSLRARLRPSGSPANTTLKFGIKCGLPRHLRLTSASAAYLGINIRTSNYTHHHHHTETDFQKDSEMLS
jgi:hypothetical protein